MRNLFALIALVSASAAHALVPEQCARTTHISHGGQADHVDLGQGRVMWRDWWSQEGTSTDVTIMDCAPGTALKARVAEENMNARLPFDKTDKALEAIALHEKGARVFATLERMAADLGEFSRDVVVGIETRETCACAAFYPELRGDKEEFRLEGL
ncbi:MAG: hypothetical protein AB8B47_00355 [Roseobacter sp.]